MRRARGMSNVSAHACVHGLFQLVPWALRVFLWLFVNCWGRRRRCGWRWAFALSSRPPSLKIAPWLLCWLCWMHCKFSSVLLSWWTSCCRHLRCCRVLFAVVGSAAQLGWLEQFGAVSQVSKREWCLLPCAFCRGWLSCSAGLIGAVSQVSKREWCLLPCAFCRGWLSCSAGLIGAVSQVSKRKCDVCCRVL